MFSRFQQMRDRRDGGFTLIELLVVILIIAILAAIAIPVFLNQRKKGWISQMEAALKNAATAAESYATGQGDYGGLTEPKLVTEGWKKATDVTTDSVTVSGTNDDYCVQVSHAKLDDVKKEPMGISSDSTTPLPGTCALGVFTATAP